MTTAFVDQKFFRGRIHRIRALDRVDVVVDLPFDLSLRKPFLVGGFSFDTDQLDESTYSKARHALIVLLGGKHVLIAPDITLREEWGSRPDIVARIYLLERVHGRPIGLSGGIVAEPVLDIGPFFTWVAERGFQLSDVKRVLNGTGGGQRG